MSKSDAQRRSYLADQMTMGERVEALQNKVAELSFAAECCLKHRNALERRLDEIDNPGMTHFVGDDCAGGHQPSLTECGRVVVDANEWDRLNRLEKAVHGFKQRERGEVAFGTAASWNAWMAVTRELK